MKKFLILGGFLIGMACQAQITNISVQVAANYPLIKDVERTQALTNVPIIPSTGFSSTVSTGGLKESFSSKLGFQLGGQFDYDLPRRFFLSSGISVCYVRFQRRTSITGLTNGDILVRIPNLPDVVGQPYGVIRAVEFQRDPDGRPAPRIPAKSENLGNTTALSVQLPVLIGRSFLQNKLAVKGGAVISYLLHATEIKDKYE
jgi:hypothetical protein